MGIPIISTSIGAEGLEVKSGQNILIADSAKEFSDAIVKILSDESLASRIKQNAFDLVQKKYSWDVVWDSLSSQYPQLN